MIWASILHLKCEKVVKFIVFIGIVRELPPPPLVMLLGQLIMCTAHSHRHSQYYGRKHSTKCTTDFQSVLEPTNLFFYQPWILCDSERERERDFEELEYLGGKSC